MKIPEIQFWDGTQFIRSDPTAEPFYHQTDWLGLTIEYARIRVRTTNRMFRRYDDLLLVRAGGQTAAYPYTDRVRIDSQAKLRVKEALDA